MASFNLSTFREPYRAEKRDAMNQVGALCAQAVLEMSRRHDLRCDEVAWVLLSLNTVVLRNRGGANLIAANLEAVAQKMHEYAQLLRKREAMPTDNILPV